MTPFEKLSAALDAQARAKKRYYAQKKVSEWGALWQDLVRANAEVVAAAREFVAEQDAA